MKKVVRITESDLTRIVKRVVKESSDYSVEPQIPTQPRERDVKSVFGQKYGAYIPNDVLRYMRKSPAKIFKRLYELYGDKAYEYLDMASGKSSMGSEEMELDEMMDLFGSEDDDQDGEYYEECPNCDGEGCGHCDYEGNIPLRDNGEYLDM